MTDEAKMAREEDKKQTNRCEFPENIPAESLPSHNDPIKIENVVPPPISLSAARLSFSFMEDPRLSVPPSQRV
jgi:hypothetical protein